MGLLAPAAKASPGVFHRLEPMENRWIFLHFDFESAVFTTFMLIKREKSHNILRDFEDLEISVGDVGSIVEGAAPHKFS